MSSGEEVLKAQHVMLHPVWMGNGAEPVRMPTAIYCNIATRMATTV